LIMTLSRPNVVVYQEYVTISVAPDIPDLGCMIVGPCNQLLDYLDDKSDCYAADYGTLNSVVGGAVPSAVIIASPPNIAPGALLADASVRMFIDEYRAILHEKDGSGGDDRATFYAGENWFLNEFPGGVHFGEEGVSPGDLLLAKTGASTADALRTVKNLTYALLDITPSLGSDSWLTAGAVAGDTVTIYSDEAGTPRDGDYTVKEVSPVMGGTPDDETLIIENAANLIKQVAADAHVRVTSPGGTVRFDTGDVSGPTSGSKMSLGDSCNLQVTADFVANNDGTDANRAWRIERELIDEELDAADFSVDNITKAVTVDAGMQVNVGTLGAKDISYAKLYMEYSALRQDLQNPTELVSTVDFEALGKLDSRNPLRVGATVAAQNTSTSILVYGLTSDDMAGYMDFEDRTSMIRDMYAIVPLTYNISVIGYLKTIFENYADPTYVLDNGIRQKFRVVIGAVELTTERYVTAETGGASTAKVPITGAGFSDRRTATLAITGSPTITPGTGDFAADDIIPGDRVTFVLAGVNQGTFKIAHVNGALEFEVSSESGEAALPDLSSLVAITADYVSITDSTGVTEKLRIVYASAGNTFAFTAAVLDALFLELSVPTATFLGDGVVPGDILQMPADPENPTVWTDYQSWVVASVESETRLVIVNSGTNTPTVANELPHGVKRSATPTDRLITDGEMVIRVLRDMTKSQQVTYMLEIAQSLDSKRALLCYPDEVAVVDLVDGSAERFGALDPVAAGRQPGYYLSCAVGGQTAGQPPQQGFTFLSINGISRVYNSNDYFREEQLTDLSNGGVYVFIQDNPDALPYSIHEVTTDVLSLETGEYMAVKNFDFISWVYLDTLFGFIGKWNINTDTIKFIRQAINASSGNLKSRKVARIGAPLLSASINSIGVDPELTEDRLEVKMSVNMPMVLNTIGLHLVG
jgi:hypothetical protein